MTITTSSVDLLKKALLLVTLFGSVAFAQNYPDRSIKILQGFAPGGNADAIARAVGTEISKSLGQAVVVEAQAGAGGTIAATTVAKAKPDGYTLLLATGGHAVAGAIYNNLNYKTVQDFEMISTITYFPFLIVVSADNKIANFPALLAQAKANPGKIAYGTAGIGSTHHLAGELLASMAKVDLLHVPYRGDAGSITALLSGDVPFIIAPPTAVLSNIKAGKLKAIAATGPQRWTGLPDVPTVAELGFPGFDANVWYMLMGPPGLPTPIAERWVAAVNKAFADPALRQRVREAGFLIGGGSQADAAAMLKNDADRYAALVRGANIKLD